jgi:hypothetical protein
MFEAVPRRLECDEPTVRAQAMPMGPMRTESSKWNDRPTLVLRTQQMPPPDSLHRLTLVTCLIA